MKILIAYYSKTGITKRVANDLAKKLNADIDEIIDLKNRSGIFGWILGGRDAMKGYLTEIKTIKNPKDYDLVIIGTPVWAANSTPAVRTYIHQFKDQLKKVAVFSTSGDTPPEKPAKFLEAVLAKKISCFAGWNTSELKDNNIYEEKLKKFGEELLKT